MHDCLTVYNGSLLLHINSYTMGMSGLPDIYTQSLRAIRPRAEGVYIR